MSTGGQRMRSALLSGFLFFLMSGCAAVQLTAAGKAVRMIVSDPPPGCEEVGGVSGFSGGFHEDLEEEAKAIMRNKAAQLGANVVRVETSARTKMGDVKMSGTAFKCAQ